MRLIDADKIGLTDFEIIQCDGDYKRGLALLIEKLNNAPTIEAEPIKHGHWVLVSNSEPYNEYVCSVCGTKALGFIGGSEMWYCLFKPHFCPNCGAKMDGVEE